MNHFHSILYSLLSCLTLTASAQLSVTNYPVRFSNYYTSYTTVNPAAAGCYGKYELTAGNKRLLGNLSKITTYYATGNMRISRNQNDNKPFSSIGFYLYTDREGQYLQRSRAYLLYAWNGKISSKLRVSGGFQLGVMNYSVKGTALSGDGSDFAPDGSVGVRIYGHRFHIGVSYWQVFNQSIQPLEEVAILSPFTNLTGSWKFDVSENVLFRPSFCFRLQSNSDTHPLDLNLNFDIKEKLFLSSGLHQTEMLVHTVGLKNLLKESGGLNLYFSYSYFYRKKGLNIKFAELGLAYIIK